MQIQYMHMVFPKQTYITSSDTADRQRSETTSFQ